MKLKTSEARILIFLETSDPIHHYAQRIASKLDMDYVYAIRIIKAMKDKEWIHAVKRERKIFYNLNKAAPVDKAKIVISSKK